MSVLLDFSTPHVLRDAAEHEAAHAELVALLDRAPAPDSVDGERLEFLAVLIAAYDAAHPGPVDEPATPQELVLFALEQRGQTRADLIPLLGGKSRVSEFFSGKRLLSISQVRALRDAYGIPADLLIPPSDADDRA